MTNDVLLNEARAHSSARDIAVDSTRNLVLFAIAEASMRAVRRVGQSDDDWRSGLPAQPFDMQFFCDVLASMFSKEDIVRGVLDGKSLAEASGWDTDHL